MTIRRAAGRAGGMPAMNLMLRPATPDDAPALARVHVASWHEAYREIVPPAYLEGFTVQRCAERLRKFLAGEAAAGDSATGNPAAGGPVETYAAEHEGRLVGLLTLGGCRDADAEHANHGEIWGIYISPEYWRRGIGRFLCGQAERLLASRGCTIVTLWVLEANNRARRFYEAMGFSPDGTTKEVHLGASLKALRYRKTLRSNG